MLWETYRDEIKKEATKNNLEYKVKAATCFMKMNCDIRATEMTGQIIIQFKELYKSYKNTKFLWFLLKFHDFCQIHYPLLLERNVPLKVSFKSPHLPQINYYYIKNYCEKKQFSFSVLLYKLSGTLQRLML